jgi:hypothetical protein
MTTYIESKLITLTSQSATITRNGSFQSHVWYDMGLFVKDEPDIIHKQITLLSAQIPYSFYVVNYTNNTIVFKAVEDANYTTATIPVGNYTGNSLITVLKALFANPLSITVTITLSPINGTITITRDVSDFQISATSTCLEILGFEKNTTYTSTASVLTSPYPLNLLGIKVLEVRSSTLNMLNYSSLNGGITTLLGTIPVSAVPFGMIDYVDKGNSKITFSNGSLDELDIEILDGETGQYINFNNQDWTMTILITITRLMQSIMPAGGIKQFPSQPALPTAAPPKVSQGSLTNEQSPPPPNKDLEELNLLAS